MDFNYFTRVNNEIDPTAIIDPSVRMGKGNIIGPYCVIRGDVTIGNNNYFGPHVVIGEPAEYRIHPEGKHDTAIRIGNRNRISEFVAVQSGILTDATEIGDNCYIMHGCHIAHDNKIGDEVTIAPLVCLGGAVVVMEFANIGMNVAVHPRLKIGTAAMVGMNATVTKDIPDFETWAGTPAKFMKQNVKGYERWMRMRK